MRDNSAVDGVVADNDDHTGRTPPSATLVHGVVWDHEPALRWQSMPEYLNFQDLRVDNIAAEKHGGQQPKVSLTLSDFLQSEESCGSCDFGWFTPSANSLGSLDDLTPLGAENHVFTFVEPVVVGAGAPAAGVYPRHYHDLALATDKEFGSTANTAALSPSSTVGHSRDACSSAFCPSGQDADTAKKIQGKNTPPFGNQHHRCPAQEFGGTSMCKGTDSSGGRGGVPGAEAGNARRPVRSRKGLATNRMPEINQWHDLHRGASSSGSLAAESEGGGQCTLHIRRSAFPLSTRHFPANVAPKSEPLSSSPHSNRRQDCRSSPHKTLLSPQRRAQQQATADGRTGDGRNPLPLTALKEQNRGSVRIDDRKENENDSSSSNNNGSPAVSDRVSRRTRDFVEAAADARGVGGGRGRLGGVRGRDGMDTARMRKRKPNSYSWALTEIRVVTGCSPWAPPHAEYLVVACLGPGKLVAGWRRASDFARLARVAQRYWMSKACVAWESLERARRMDGGGPFNLPWVLRPRRLDPVYLQNKARFLEEFLKQFVFEANSRDALLAFLDPARRSTMEL